jgi:hypothetical protein
MEGILGDSDWKCFPVHEKPYPSQQKIDYREMIKVV